MWRPQVRVTPEGSDRLELQRELERVLYHDQEAADRFFADCERGGFAVAEGSDLEFVRVLPSYLDRKPFFELLIEGRIARDLQLREEGEEPVISLQKDAKRWFDSQVEQHVAKYRVVHVVMQFILLT